MTKGMKYSPITVRRFIQDDPLAEFQFETLIELEDQTEEEALLSIYKDLILDDVFRMDRYYELSKIKTLA